MEVPMRLATACSIVSCVCVLAGCGSSEPAINMDVPAVPSTQNVPDIQPLWNALAASTLTVQDADGNAIDLKIGSSDKVVAVASWCPHTKSFIQAISDPRVRRELRRYHWIFLFESDEWTSVKGQLGDGPEAAAQLAMLKERAGDGPLFDPEFLDGLPGDFYFFRPGYRQKDFGFPSLYSTEQGRFTEHPVNWLADKSERAVELYLKFEKDNG
jgi:hypothetical protein